MFPGLSYVKLIGGVAVLLLILGLVADRGRFMHRAHVAEALNADACAATRTAAARPKLDCKQVAQQITFLGDALNDVKAKTEAAKASDAAHATTVEAKQNTTSQESSHDYEAQIAAVRADYAQRLRAAAEAAAAHSGGGGHSPVPGPAASTGRLDASAAQAQLPSADALTATEQAIQLKAFQDWACKEGLFVAKCPVPVPVP